jgi:hypothetical protein
MLGVFRTRSRRLLLTALGSSCIALVACSATDTIESVPDTKAVLLETEQNVCPQITAFNISPLTAAIGGHIDVSSSAEDSDGTDGLTFFWLTTSGAFEDRTAPTTRYFCEKAGNYLLHLVVSDGRCGDERWLPIQCVNLWGQSSSSAPGAPQASP